MISADQCRAARIFAGLSAQDLAEAADVGIATVKRFESGQSVSVATIDALEAALTSAGVIFLEAGEVSRRGGLGVRYTPLPQTK